METTVFADTCPYMTRSLCNVATLKCNNSNVPCNTSNVNAQAKQLLTQALRFQPPVMSGGGVRMCEPYGAGFDAVQVGNFAQAKRWEGYDSYSFK